MRIYLLLFLIGVLTISIATARKIDVEDNEFAEFEEFDEEEIPKEQEESTQSKIIENVPDLDDDEVKVEEEFDHFNDEEEFEGINQERHNKGKLNEKPDLKINKVPSHMRRNWENYYLELLMVSGLVVYAISYMMGRNKNSQLSNAWFSTHKQLLESNFTLVGDDGKKELENPGLVKHSENVYTLWCSGRVCVEGMLVELKLLKRQDLISVLSYLMKPAVDQIVVKVEMAPEVMDSFVFCLASKKTALRLGREMIDLSTFCPDKKSPDKFGIPSSFLLMSEIGEASSTILDQKIVTQIKKYEEYIDYIYFSDQFMGPKQEDAQPTKMPESKKMLMFSFNAPCLRYGSVEQIENLKPLMNLVFYFIEKIRKFRLSKEAKIKAEKNRQKVLEHYMKTTHAQRQEAAQQRREEKKRLEKEKIMNEEDPEKQRKWEEREHRRELKKKAPKLKQLKVKAI